MRADVADRAERAAAVRLEPPVPVAVEQQPVLEVAAGHEADVAELAAGDDVVGVLVERVVADVEVGRVDDAGRCGGSRPARRDSAAVIARGFSQTTCRPAARIAERLRQVEVVGRGDVDDVDARVARAGRSSES